MVEKYPGKTDTKFHEKLHEKQHIVNVAAGREPADLVLKNAKYINVFSNDLLTGDIAIARGRIVGIGSYQGKPDTLESAILKAMVCSRELLPPVYLMILIISSL